MKTYPTEKIRNLVLAGPHGVGKTALADAILHVTGKVGRRGSVDDGSSVFDYLDEEIAKRQTMSASLAWTEDRGHKLNLIDTPGVEDFRGDLYASLVAVEGVVFVVKGDGGFEVAANSLWNLIRQFDKPTVIAVNRMNKEHANWQESLASIRENVGVNAVPVQLPIGEREGFEGVVDLVEGKAYRFEDGQPEVMDVPADLQGAVEAAREGLMDAAAETVDELMEKYLEEGSLTREELVRGLKAGISAGTVYPIVVTAADSEVGVTNLVRAVIDLLPSPQLIESIEGINPDRDEAAAFPCSPGGDPLAFAFKKQFETQGGDVVWLRVFSGTLESGANLTTSPGGNSERLGQMNVVVGKQKEKVDTAVAGDIVVAAKLKVTGIGTTLHPPGKPFALPPVPYATPTFSEAIRPVTVGDEDKMATGLSRIRDEDPTFELRHQADLHQSVLVTQGETHTAYILDKLKKATGVEVERERPRVAFKETVKGTAEKQGRHKKQTGGRGQFGDVHLRIDPLPRGSGFEFADEVVGGVVPNKFIPAVEKGCRETLKEGLVAGYEMVDVKVALFFGSYHAVDSSEAAFKTAARIALRRAVDEEADKLRPVILEPVMNVKITVPQAYMGDVMGDISTRRGQIQGSETQGSYQVVGAVIPEDELYGYATTLRSMTQGTGTFTMEFSHYAEVPGDVQARLVSEYKKRHTEAE
ncbi:MAG: elongation factor G [Candidatus Krumholzibacteriia bacterium]